MNMMVVGDQNKVNLEFLSKYGKLEKVSLDKIFGETGVKP